MTKISRPIIDNGQYDKPIGSLTLTREMQQRLSALAIEGHSFSIIPIIDIQNEDIKGWSVVLVPVVSGEAAIDELRRELQQIDRELTVGQREQFEAAAQRGLQHNAIREAITPLIVALDDFIQKSAEGDDLYKAALRKKMIKEKTDLEDKYEVYPLRGEQVYGD